MGSLPCLPSQGLMKMYFLEQGPAWHLHRQGLWASTCVLTAYIPDGSYSYITSSASEFLHILTFPRAAGAQVVYSQVEVSPAWS